MHTTSKTKQWKEITISFIFTENEKINRLFPAMQVLYSEGDCNNEDKNL